MGPRFSLALVWGTMGAACAFQAAPIAGAGDATGGDSSGPGDAGEDGPGLDTPDLDAPGGDAPDLDGPGLDGPYPDAPGLDAPAADAAPPDAGALGPFGPPTPVTPLNTPGTEDDASLTGDMLEIFFDRNGDIFTSRRAAVTDAWGAPTAVAAVNSLSTETTPEVAVDGLVLWFASNRPGGSGDHDIYVSTRADRATAWRAPLRVTELCSTLIDYAPTPGADLLAMVLTSTRPGVGAEDLYWTTRASPSAFWAAPVLLAGVNTAMTETDAWLDATRTVLYFSTDRPGGAGDWDIWRAARPDPSSPFGTPVPVAELNTGLRESDVWLSPDMRTIYFTSRAGGSADIYMATR